MRLVYATQDVYMLTIEKGTFRAVPRPSSKLLDWLRIYRIDESDIELSIVDQWWLSPLERVVLKFKDDEHAVLFRLTWEDFQCEN